MKRIITIIMSVALLVCAAIPTFASTDHIEDYIAYDKITYTGTDENLYSVFVFRITKNPYEQYSISPSNDVRILLNKNTKSLYVEGRDNNYYKYVHYRLNTDDILNSEIISGLEVYKNATKIGYGNGLEIGVKTIHESDLNIYDYENEELVFPPTPTISQILTEEVPDLVVSPIMKTLSTLIPFGVGLMALLILLVILKKIFYLFQV